MRTIQVLALTIFALTMLASTAGAWNQVTNTNSDYWAVNDAAIPGLDTGSIHNTATGSLQGYGGIRMEVAGGSDRLSGILLRGFGLKFDGVNQFLSQNAVKIDGVAASRQLLINKTDNWARFFDSFTNTTKATVTVDVAFGGQLGYNTGTNQSAIKSTSSGDTTITSADGWFSSYTPSAGPGTASANGPSATTVGTAGYASALTKTGPFVRDPFSNALPTTGDESNHVGLVTRLIIPPKQTRSVTHFVVTGLSETRTTPSGGAAPGIDTQTTAVETMAAALATTPDFSGLTTGEICSIVNYNLSALTIPGFSSANCPLTQGEPLSAPVLGSVAAPTPVTTSPYDVVGKSITDLKADLAEGKTNVRQIVRAYLDRIAVYDQGPLGLHSVLAVAPDAMEQAKAADAARAAGDKRPLLGIPILAKDLYDTKDMPTTGGSLVFDGYRPTKDSWIVAKLREAGAIILGKANLAEYATDGHFSPSAYGQVWNAFDPSRSSIGSSGGSAVAVASSFAAASLGSQTGDSLWGPSSAASLVSLRGTDGMQSADGVMPLTFIQDYAGVIAKTLPDLALMLDATTADNPEDPRDDVSNGHRPTDWSATLKDDALVGKTIGIPAGAFNDPFGTTGTKDAMMAAMDHFEAAGATVVDIPAPPSAPSGGNAFGDMGYTGWWKWMLAHPNNPYSDVTQIIRNPLRIPQFRNTTPYAGTGAATDEQIVGREAYRANYRALLKQWMDDNGVDATVFPGQLSDIHLNDSIQPSFGRLDPQSSASGVPTVIFPAGVNDHGQPINLQLEGPEFSDAELMGFAYAFEKQANGQVEPLSTTPSLTYDSDAIPPAVETTLPVLPTPVTPVPTITTPKSTKTLTVLVSSVKSSGKKHPFKVLIGCAAEKETCTGKVAVKVGGKTFAKSVTVKPGKLVAVKITPPASSAKLLAKKKKVKATVTITGTGDTLGAKATTVTVK
ncbi:MAG: amidase [Thermoleophilaceae bacterium]|nr:amidase [Thermoleophilaceae bacterium]